MLASKVFACQSHGPKLYPQVSFNSKIGETFFFAKADSTVNHCEGGLSKPGKSKTLYLKLNIEYKNLNL